MACKGIPIQQNHTTNPKEEAGMKERSMQKQLLLRKIPENVFVGRSSESIRIRYNARVHTSS